MESQPAAGSTSPPPPTPARTTEVRTTANRRRNNENACESPLSTVSLWKERESFGRGLVDLVRGTIRVGPKRPMAQAYIYAWQV